VTAAGTTSFCTDGLLDPREFCDDGNTNNADSCANSCTCGAGYHDEGGICANDVRGCTVNDGTATETWNGSAYGPCTLTGCNSGFHATANVCYADVVPCSTPGATAATQTWDGSVYGACTATACEASYHVEDGECVSDIRSCAITNGTGSQTYSSGAWGSCSVVTCNTNYHLESGGCMSDSRSCLPLPPNALAGTQLWDGAGYGSCTVSACVEGYVAGVGECVIAPSSLNILIERFGDGTTALANTGATVSLLEFTPAGVAVSTNTFPTIGANRLVEAGTTVTQGYFGARNGVVAVAGYDAPIPTTSLVTATGVNRVANVFNGDLTIVNSSRLTFGTSAAVASTNLRSIVPLTASTGYIGGNTSGITYYSGNALTPILAGNFRNIEVYDGQLYYSTNVGTAGIFKLGAGTPTSAATATRLIATPSSPYGFVIFDTNTDGTPDVAYVCDDSSPNNLQALVGGLKRYSYVAGAWSHVWTRRTAVAPSTALGERNANACTGLTGSYENGTATLYFTEANITSNNRVMRVIDAGTAPTTATTIATAGANYAFRGVDLKGF
jgi:cysteine-rich repeat protein